LAQEIKGVLFDMDGVLIDSMPEHYRAWSMALGEAGMEVSEEEIYRREGEKGEVTARDMLKAHGIMITKKRVRHLLDRKEEIFRTSSVIRPFSNAETVVAAVASLGLPLGLVTGTSAGEMAKVLPEEIRRHFAVFVTGDQVRRGKPNPEPYLKGIFGLGIQPGQTLVVENAPYGIQSAKAAGAVCVAIRSYLSDEHLAGAHFLLDGLDELEPFLREKL